MRRINFLFIIFILVVLDLRCYVRLSLVAVSGGLLFLTVLGFLIVLASLVVEDRLSGTWASGVAASGL